MAAVAEDDEYEIPLRDQRYFGAGIKRRRVQFVPARASSPNFVQPRHSPAPPSTSAAQRYMSIVLPPATEGERCRSAPPQAPNLSRFADPVAPARSDSRDGEHSPSVDRAAAETGKATAVKCNVCHRPIVPGESVTRHEASLAHQISLQHSHPPSHVDRKRKGLAVLESYGWDPDSRLGLGARGSEGRLHPVKAVENPDRAGIGAKFPDGSFRVKERPAKLDAGKARRKDAEGKKKGARLRDAFYRSEEVERYLGQAPLSQAGDWDALQRPRRGK